MHADRLVADVQLTCNLAVAAAEREQGEDLVLAAGQGERRVGARLLGRGRQAEGANLGEQALCRQPAGGSAGQVGLLGA